MPTPDTAAAPEVTHTDDSGASVTTALHRAALGPISSDYYLPIFTRFEAAGRGGPSWNWAASIYTFNWLIFRRMWGAALTYAAVVLCAALLLFGLGSQVFDDADTLVISVWGGLAALYFVVPGVYGNQLLHAATRKQVLHALTVSKTLKEACEKLSLQAASRQRFIWLVLTNLLLLSAVAGVYLAFPDTGASVQKALVMEAKGKADQNADKKPTPITIATPASAPELTLAASAPALAASSGQEVLPSKPESTRASATQEEIEAMDAAALRYVPRRPLVVSAAASAPVVMASAEAVQPPASSPQAALQYYINVGLFANDWNARYAQAKLTDAGLVSFRQALTSSKGKLTRVRVGPFDSKAEVDAAVKKIHELGLDAVVIQL
jgi:cell division protein FtsN